MDSDNSSGFCFAATAAKFENAKHLLTLPLVSRCPQSLGWYFIVHHFAGEARFSNCPCLVPTPPSPLPRGQRPSMVLTGVSFLWTSSSRVSSAMCQALLGFLARVWKVPVPWSWATAPPPCITEPWESGRAGRGQDGRQSCWGLGTSAPGVTLAVF